MLNINTNKNQFPLSYHGFLISYHYKIVHSIRFLRICIKTMSSFC